MLMDRLSTVPGNIPLVTHHLQYHPNRVYCAPVLLHVQYSGDPNARSRSRYMIGLWLWYRVSGFSWTIIGPWCSKCRCYSRSEDDATLPMSYHDSQSRWDNSYIWTNRPSWNHGWNPRATHSHSVKIGADTLHLHSIAERSFRSILPASTSTVY